MQLVAIVLNWPRQCLHIFRADRGEASDYHCDKRIAVYVEALKALRQQRDATKRHRAEVRYKAVAGAGRGAVFVIVKDGIAVVAAVHEVVAGLFGPLLPTRDARHGKSPERLRSRMTNRIYRSGVQMAIKHFFISRGCTAFHEEMEIYPQHQ